MNPPESLLPPDLTASSPTLPDRTWVEIDLAAVRHNSEAAQACFPESAGPGVLAVVKADGYGLGMIPVARAMESVVRAFAVANVQEAKTLKSAGIERPVYVLGPALPGEWEAVVAGGFCAPVSSLEEVSGYTAAAKRLGRKAAVHVVVDTGMGRIGCRPEEAAPLVKAVVESPWLELDSVASHFPSADDDPAWTQAQAERFAGLMAEVEKASGKIAHTQLANSAGLTSYPIQEGSWGRAGLMLYGVSPVAEEQHRLRPVVTWKAGVTLVRWLPEGHGVSYGRTFVTTRPTRVATLAVGYADGYPRQASGQGASVLLGGQRCPVLGRVTMDQIMVDTTDLLEAPRPGDTAVLLGSQGGAEISAVELAGWGGTIAWDIFTGLGPRVRRVYLEGRL